MSKVVISRKLMGGRAVEFNVIRDYVDMLMLVLLSGPFTHVKEFIKINALIV